MTQSPQKVKSPPIVKKKILVGLLMIAVLVPVLFIGMFVLSFNGGVQGIKNFFRPPPDPSSTQVEKKRADSLAFIDNQLRDFDEQKDTGVIFLAESRSDACYEGEASWKRTDNFSNKCNQKIVHYYGTNNDIRNEIVQFGGFLTANNWQDTGFTRGNTETEVALSRYDEYGYLVPVRAEKDGAVIEMQSDEMNQSGIYSGINQWAYIGHGFYQKNELQDTQKLYTEAFLTYKYVIAVSIEDTYFQN